MAGFAVLIKPEDLLRISPRPPDSANLGTYHARWLSAHCCRLRTRYPWGCWPAVAVMLLWGAVLVYGGVTQIRKGNVDKSLRGLLYGSCLLVASTPMFIRGRTRIDGELGEVTQTRWLVGRKRTPFADLHRVDLQVIELGEHGGCRLHLDPPSHDFLQNNISASLASDVSENIVLFAIWLATTLSRPLYLAVSIKYDGTTRVGKLLSELRKLDAKEEELL